MKSSSNYDVAVIGGGPAGSAAAIAAARMGAKTLLVERLGYLGGMATSGLVVPHFEVARCGISIELAERMRAMGGWGTKYWEASYDPELWKHVSEQMALEAKVELLMYSQLIGVEKAIGSVAALAIQTKSGPHTVSARAYVDSTGDGDLAFMAGVPYQKGRPRDGKLMPMTMMFRMENVQYEQFSESQLYQDIMNAASSKGLAYRPPYHRPWIINLPAEGQAVAMFTHIYDCDGTDSADLTKASIEGRRQALEAWRFLKDNVKGFEHSRFVCTSDHIGVRETRRFDGEYVLSRKDVENRVAFDDVVALCHFPIDIHEPDQGLQTNITLEGEYGIPYRCLLPQGCSNLLLSGRNISGSYEAFASYRVKGIAMSTGQAAGTAAAISVDRGVSIKAVSMPDLQRQLQKDGVNLGRPGDRSTAAYANFPPGCRLET
jgi:hypothetical protein